MPPIYYTPLRLRPIQLSQRPRKSVKKNMNLIYKQSGFMSDTYISSCENPGWECSGKLRKVWSPFTWFCCQAVWRFLQCKVIQHLICVPDLGRESRAGSWTWTFSCPSATTQSLGYSHLQAHFWVAMFLDKEGRAITRRLDVWVKGWGTLVVCLRFGVKYQQFIHER